MLFREDEVTIKGFLEIFRRIVQTKEKAGIKAVLNNPSDLEHRAKLYGTQFRNGSWGWASNIWSRSAAGTQVVDREEDLKPEHRLLMLRVLEHILAQGPLIQVDRNLGSPGSKAEMRCRLYCDPQFPDLAYRWGELNFPGDPKKEPDAVLFMIPHYLGYPNVPGSSEMLRVLRFPHHGYTIVTCSSYQGEVKKGFLSHWIFHVYKRGGTGEHASLREFTVRRIDGSIKRIAMCVWGLTGSGKSTHGMYMVTEKINDIYKEKFGVDLLSFVSDQVLKNDDIVGIFRDQVVSPERGSWTKTEDVDERQPAIFRAGMSPRALHENTEFDERGYPSFKGELFQYFGRPNQNARTVFYLEDTGFHDGDVNSSGPLNMAVFISPGFISDYAWVKIEDVEFAAKVLADGRTVGHPAQSKEVVGKVRFVARYAQPFTMGVGNTAHVVRFYEMLRVRAEKDPVEVFLWNTTGRIVAKYEWVEKELGGRKILAPEPVLAEVDGIPKPVGGERPTIEETELFLLQATRGAVEYEAHPVWGEKVLVPKEVPGIPRERLKKLNPLSYLSEDEFRALLRAQVQESLYWLDRNCPGLPEEIRSAMNFE